MFLQHRQAFSSAIRLLDVGVLCAALIVHTDVPDGYPTLGWSTILELVVAMGAWTAIGSWNSLYRSRRTSPLGGELLLLLQSIVLTAGVVALARDLLRHPGSMHVLPALATAFGGVAGVRLLIRIGLKSLRRRGKNTRSYLLVGRGKSAARIAEDIQRHPEYGVKLLGDLLFTGEQHTRMTPGLHNLGTTAQLPELVRDQAIDEVIVCPSDSVWMTEVRSVLRFCEALGISCRLAPDFLGIPMQRASVAWIGAVPAYALQGSFVHTRLLGFKRLVDLLGAAAGLLVLAPLMATLAIVIKLQDRGPIFFRQQRVGLNGRTFTLLKFRSMVVDAERLRDKLLDRNEQSGPVFKIKDDPRITRLGRFLRRYSLDELPQLLNVLLGQMSLVGPRPPLPREVVQYDWWQRRRLSVRPGLTCLWQVSGRNKVGFEHWMELDLAYIDGWSLGLDLKIIAKTVREVLRGSGS